MNNDKTKNVEKIISEQEIKNEVSRLGSQISNDYLNKDLVIISVLKSSVYFLTDLTRYIDIPLHIDFLEIDRVPNSSDNTGIVRITKDLKIEISNKDVILLDVILNTGLTHGYLLQNLESRNPNSLTLCTLLFNPEKRLVELPVSYSGFEISDIFLVGYGLDYQEEYRHLPYIGELKRE